MNFVYLPMAIISGTFFTPKDYPGFLRAIADVLPLTYFTKLTRDVMVRHHHIWSETEARSRSCSSGARSASLPPCAGSAGSRARAELEQRALSA